MRARTSSQLALLALGSLVFSSAAVPSEPDTCVALTESKKQALTGYVRSKYHLPDDISLSLYKDDLLPGSCYRRLVFQGTSKIRSWDLTLYLSPDQRFLTTEAYDTTLD
ncbi:MAG: hypothetical protein WBW33_15830, partial [Bryobacteraceae bacterium]